MTELKMRLTLVKGHLKLAWLALWSDSTVHSAVLVNAFREEGTAFISSVKNAKGERINIPHAH
jgi:hypothetical protein